MELDYFHQLKKLKYPLYCFHMQSYNWSNKNTICVLSGQKASGKTRIAFEFMEQHPNSFYFSFAGLSKEMALRFFCRKVREQTNMDFDCQDWNDVFDTLTPHLKRYKPILIFDDVDTFPDNDSFLSALSEFLRNPDSPWIFVLLLMRDSDCLHYRGLSKYTINIKYRTIADIKKAFPKLANKDILRLYAITGGIPALLSTYDEEKTFEENLYAWLSYDSVFYCFLPELLQESFRVPETYHAILYSISRGHHRISEIGNDLGFPYNKCDKYIDALRKHGVVKARQEDSKRSTYHITNSYINFWYHNLYENKDRITPSPSQEFTDAILERLDGEYTFPCYHDACLRWLKKRGSPLHASPIFSELGDYKGEPLTVKLDNGEAFTFEYSARQGDSLLLAKFQSDFDTRYDKELFLKTIASAEEVNIFYNTAIAIFSTNRFSDYCVHAVSKMDNVLLIPIIQLKY